jgi:DNA polymerase-1
MVNIAHRLAKEGYKARMLLQVHDELVFDVPEGELESVTTLVTEEMEGAVDVSVSLLVEVGNGHNWREAH